MPARGRTASAAMAQLQATASPYQLIPTMERYQFLIELKEAGKDGKRVGAFKANSFQKQIDNSVGPQSLRHLILKPRQIGISTYVDLRLLAKCLTLDGTRAAIISHERSATARLLRKVHLALEDLIERKVKINGRAIKLKYSTKYEISFPSTHSSLYIGTAGQRAFSRGDSLTDLHGSEVAVWHDAVEMMTGIEGALTPTAEVFLESTANGMGGYFYDMVTRCRPDASGKTPANAPAMLHFFPWKDHDEYSTKPPQDVVWSAQELALAREHKLTTSQLWWRRKKCEKYDKLDDFLQEYPLTIDEAFIVAGACYFDKDSLREAQTRIFPPIFKGSIETVGPRAVLRHADSGPVEIYRHPTYGGSYLIGADCSEGVEGGDPTSACVLDRERCCEAAWIGGLLDPEEAAKSLFALGQHYNWAWLAVEDNGPGLAVLMRLQQLNYPRVFRRMELNSDDRTPRLGWHTDPRTRPLALGAIRSMLKTRVWGVASERFLKQCGTFCRQGRGQENSGFYAANSGCHDDDVMSAGIAAYLHRVIPTDLPAAEVRSLQYERPRTPVKNIIHGHKTGY
jgi:hypothetical protein